jgi:hypothetical protein
MLKLATQMAGGFRDKSQDGPIKCRFMIGQVFKKSKKKLGLTNHTPANAVLYAAVVAFISEAAMLDAWCCRRGCCLHFLFRFDAT